MKTYKFKLYQHKRNKHLHRTINLALGFFFLVTLVAFSRVDPSWITQELTLLPKILITIAESLIMRV